MKNLTITMSDLAERYDELMIDNKAIGFTIGRGKILHWFIIPSSYGFYYAYKIDKDAISGVGYRRVVEVDKEITIHYEK